MVDLGYNMYWNIYTISSWSEDVHILYNFYIKIHVD